MFSLFESSTPQLYLDIDRTKVQMLGVNMADVFGALQTVSGLQPTSTTSTCWAASSA